MILRYSRLALADLDQIYSYIARDNPAAASKVKRGIQNTIDSLADSPRLGRIAKVAGVYKLVVTGLPYIIAYEVHDSRAEVWILRIYHGARLMPY